MTKKPTAQTEDKYVIRFPAGMRDRLKNAAERNNRSMNAEIVSKLDRYDSLGGEVDALWEVALALAAEIDKTSGPDPADGPLVDKINDAFEAVDEDGNVDRARLKREYAAAASDRLAGAHRGAIQVAPSLLKRIKAKAEMNGRAVDAEITATLEREYPPPTDVMHVHLDNIRIALDKYERATDPRERMHLQSLVEAMVTSGHSLELDWDEDEDK